jgi:PKD repeat protein
MMKISTRTLLTVIAAGMIATASAQLSIPALNSPQTIDFTGFAGAGFSPSPAAGQLDSDTWSILGFDAGNMPFGATQTTAATDFTRGTSTGGPTTGGVYAFDTGSGNIILGFQPTGADFSPGTLLLRIQNTTGTIIQDITVSYDFFYLNNADRGNSFNLLYSNDTLQSSFTPTAIGDTTPSLLDPAAVWTSIANSITISNVNIPNNGFFYLIWNSNDVNGSGSRDEIGIDNIAVTGSLNTPITASFTSQNVCEGIATPFADMSTSNNGPITNWDWNFGDSNTSTLQNPTHTYAAAGTYNVQLIVTNSNNDKDTVIMPVDVYPNPVATFTTTGNGGCAPACIDFMGLGSVSSGSIVSYSWDFGDGNFSTAQNPTHCYAVDGTYMPALTVTTNNGCTHTYSSPITVIPSPTADFNSSVAGSAATFTNTTTGGTGPYTYTWDFGDGSPADNTANPSHTYAIDGTYNVCLVAIDVNNCSDTTCHSVTILTTGIEQSSVLSEVLTIYPNPSTSGIVTLNFNNYSGNSVKIMVYNILGKAVYEREIISNNLSKHAIDLSKQSAGNYFISITAGGESLTRRISIK